MVNVGEQRMSRSGRKITPTRRQSFLDRLHEEARQSSEKRRMAKLKSIASKRKINYEPIGSDGSENVDTLEGSMQEFESNTDALFEMDRDVAGGNMFGFRTPKKRNALATLVANTPKTPKNTYIDTASTFIEQSTHTKK